MEITIPGTNILYREDENNQLFFHFIEMSDKFDWIAVVAPNEIASLDFARRHGEVLMSRQVSSLLKELAAGTGIDASGILM